MFVDILHTLIPTEIKFLFACKEYIIYEKDKECFYYDINFRNILFRIYNNVLYYFEYNGDYGTWSDMHLCYKNDEHDKIYNILKQYVK